MTTTTGIRRQRQQHTRERLLAAAERVFARHGFSGASVPQIAEAAGVSTGAIYSNFSGKEDLFLAMIGRVAEDGARQRAAAVAESDGDRSRLLAGMAGDWVGTVDSSPDVVVLMVEFWLYALRRPDLRGMVADFLSGVRANFETTIESLDEAPGADRQGLAMAMQALAYGYAMQRLTDPEHVQSDQFSQALEWLVTGARHAAT